MCLSGCGVERGARAAVGGAVPLGAAVGEEGDISVRGADTRLATRRPAHHQVPLPPSRPTSRTSATHLRILPMAHARPTS